MNNNHDNIQQCLFCGEITETNYCNNCITVIKENHIEIMELIKSECINVKPTEEKKVEIHDINKILIINDGDNEILINDDDNENFNETTPQQRYTARQRTLLGEEAYKKKVAEERQFYRTGTTEKKARKTKEQIAETNRLKQQRYRDKKNAKKKD